MNTTKRNPNYGRGEVKIDIEEFRKKKESREHAFAEKLALHIKQVISSKDFQPPLLPEVAVSLSEMVRKADVKIREVEKVVSRDPAVAAKVVAVANSALYNRGSPVKSLRMAITRLGLSEVRDVAFHVVAQTKIFRVDSFSDRMRELMEAAQMAGVISREICRVLKFESEQAFLCGLLHDMGEAITLGIVGETFKHHKKPLPSLGQLQHLIDQYHCAAGHRVCTIWGLPKSIADAVMHHHHPDRSTDPSKMAMVTAITDLLLTHVGIGTPKRIVDPLQEPLFYQVNLTPDQVTGLLEFAEALAQAE